MKPELIPYSRQSIDEADIEAVIAVMRGDWLTQGPAVPSFEAGVAEKCGASHAVAVNSATSALHLACLALGVGRGDLVWTSANTFAASANCALYCGASVDFVDIDAQTWNLSVEALTSKLADARSTGAPLPKLLIPVHFGGQTCDMAAISELADDYGFRILEDASHALGGHYRGVPVGSCRHSDITVFSFHPVKSITTGEGGMALTKDADLRERMARLRTHGIVRSEVSENGPWFYDQIELGFNYRMTDLQAALGLSQIMRLDEFVARRNLLAARYDELFAPMPVRAQSLPEDVHSARHLYVVRVDAHNRRRVFEDLRDHQILVNVHYKPVYLHSYYRQLGFSEGYCPEAEAYYEEAISLPLFPGLTDEQQSRVVNTLTRALEL
jgi:UDP-4-amino-4,6-dideoxy-N-acetyl-beta-L-altrosamine transaminase